jgi:hypothetical protein
MRLVLGCLLALLPTAVHAQKVPTTQVPCLPAHDELDLSAVDGAPVVCWDEKACLRIVDRDPPTLVSPAIWQPPWKGPRAEIADKDGKPSVCLAGSCKAVGKKLAAAIGAERKRAVAESDYLYLAATDDGKAVVVHGQAWNVAGDRPLQPKKPSSYDRREDRPEVIGVAVAGNLLLVSWSNCAGPCTVDQLMDPSGKNRGASISGGGGAFRLDGRHFVVFSEYADIYVFDLGGKLRGRISLDADPNSSQVIPLDEGTLAVLRTDGDEAHRLAVVDVREGNPPRISHERFLPACSPSN